jgi:hypothetical protein
MNADEFLTDVVRHLYGGFEWATIIPQDDHVLVGSLSVKLCLFTEACLPPVAGLTTRIRIDSFRKKGKSYSYREQHCPVKTATFTERPWDLTITHEDVKAAYDAIRAQTRYRDKAVFFYSEYGVPHMGGDLSGCS